MAPTAHNFCRIQLEETPRYENAPDAGGYEVSDTAFDFPVQSVLLNPAAGYIDRSDEVRGTEGGPAQLVEVYEPAGTLAQRAYLNNLPVLLECAGWKGTHEEGAGVNEAVTLDITGNPTAGGFTITWTPPGGEVTKTAFVPFNTTAARVNAVLEDAFGRGNFIVEGGPLPGTPITIECAGDYAATNVGVFTVTDSTLNAGATAAFTVDTPGAAGAVTDPDGNGIPEGAHLWSFDKRGGITAQSMQILIGYVTGVVDPIFLKGQGFGVATLGLNADGAMSADMMGLVVKRLIEDPEIVPMLDSSSILPARRGDLFVDWQEGVGTLQDFSLSIANPLVRQRTMSLARSSPFPDRLEHGDDKVRVTGAVPMHSISSVDFDTLMDGRTFAAKARWKIAQSKIGDSGADFAVWVEMPACQIVGGGMDPIANRRRFGGSFDWWASDDEDQGFDAKLYVLCGVETMTAGIS